MSRSLTDGRVSGGVPKAGYFWRDNGILVGLALLIVLATVATSGRFVAPANLVNVLYQASIVGILALGLTLVVLVGALDLSMVSIMLLSAVVMGGAGSERQVMLMFAGQLPYIGFAPALIAGLLAGALLGFVNGFAVTVLRIPSFIATLATALLISGLVLLLTGGAPISYPDPFYMAFGASSFLGLPAPVYVFAAVVMATAWLLGATTFGRQVYAIGGNERAARFSGLPIVRIRILCFVLAGAAAGIAGFLFLSRTGYVSYASAPNLLLQTIAGVVVGGIALEGGRGRVRQAVGGVLFLACLNNLMNILVISPHIQFAVNGTVLILAVSLSERFRQAR